PQQGRRKELAEYQGRDRVRFPFGHDHARQSQCRRGHFRQGNLSQSERRRLLCRLQQRSRLPLPGATGRPSCASQGPLHRRCRGAAAVLAPAGGSVLRLLSKRRPRSIVAAIGWIAALLCFFLFAPSVSRGQESVKLGLLMINADVGIFLAKERGYFQEQGISVELIFFSSSGGPQMAALTTGELDAGSGSIGPGIYNAVAGGVGLKVVATKSRVGPGRGARYVIRSSLLE